MKKQTYLVVDTDIWLNSMAGFHDDLFLVDRIEAWIEAGEVILLVPDIIIEEWKRNSTKKDQEIRKNWGQFYAAISEMFGDFGKHGLLKPDEVDEWNKKYLERVELLLDEGLHIEARRDDFFIEASKLGLGKMAPFGKKANSTADALIFLSVIDFLKSNIDSKVLFISNNKSDFSNPNDTDVLHSDLKEYIIGLDFHFYQNIGKFLYSSGLPKISAASIRSLKGISLTQRVELQAYDLSGYQDSYIEDTQFIKDVLSKVFPSKRQVRNIIDLISAEEKYAKYFFTNCDNPIWFNILNKQNYFEDDVKNKFNSRKNFFPFWYPLLYFQKLVQDETFEDTNVVVSLLINNSSQISKNGKNIYESIRILKFVPNSFYDRRLIHAIETLVQGENPAFGLVDLSELIEVKFLEGLNEKEVKISEDLLRIIVNIDDPHATFLKRAIIEKDEWLEKGARVWSSHVVLDILELLRNRFYNFSQRKIKFIRNDNELEAKFRIEGENLLIDFPQEQSLTVEGFETMDRETLDEEVKTKIAYLDYGLVDSEKNELACQTISYHVFHGDYFDYDPDSLFNLQEKNHLRTSTHVLLLFIARLISEIIKTSPKRGWEIIDEIHSTPKYRLQGFKQIVVFVIGRNWRSGGYAFLKKNYHSIAKIYLGQLSMKSDIADMLRCISLNIRKTDEKVVRSFVDSLVEYSIEGVSEWSYLNWYSTLDKSPFFENDYALLSDKLGKKVDDYGGGIQVRMVSAEVSPVDSTDLVNMPIDEIIEYIRDFKPSEEFGGATYEGLAKALGDTISQYPEVLVPHLDKFLDLPYLINYRLVWGVRDAWKNGKISDISEVLNYFRALLIAQGKEDEKYMHLGDWGANPSWIISGIGDTILSFLKADVRKVSLNYLEQFKLIINELEEVTEPTPKEKYKIAQNDAIMHAVNSPGGKLVLSVLEYGLFYSRRNENERRMLPEVKQWFEDAMAKSIIECYGVLGAYCRSWNYLDSDWTIDLMTGFLDLEDELWLIFIDGLYVGNPTNEDELIPIIKLHFERAFNYGKISESSGMRSKGAVSYLVAWLFWEKDELSDTDGINRKFFEAAQTEDIVNYLDFIWRQEKYYFGLVGKEKKKLREIISSLWDLLLKKFPKNSENTPIYSVLKYFEQFYDNLDEELSNKMRITLSGSESFLFDFHQLKAMLRFIDNSSNNILTAKYLVNYLDVIKLMDNPLATLFGDMIIVIRFLFENDQREFANKFCDYAASIENNDRYPELYREFNRQK